MWHLLPNLHEIDFLIQKKSGSALHIFALIVIFGARDSSSQGMLNVDRYESNSSTYTTVVKLEVHTLARDAELGFKY